MLATEALMVSADLAACFPLVAGPRFVSDDFGVAVAGDSTQTLSLEAGVFCVLAPDFLVGGVLFGVAADFAASALLVLIFVALII